MEEIGRYLLRPAEAASALGLSRSKVYDLIARDEIPHISIGRSRRVPVDALRKWLADHQSPAAARTWLEESDQEARSR